MTQLRTPPLVQEQKRFVAVKMTCSHESSELRAKRDRNPPKKHGNIPL